MATTRIQSSKPPRKWDDFTHSFRVDIGWTSAKQGVAQLIAEPRKVCLNFDEGV